MIYTGICEDHTSLRMAYAIVSKVFTSEREMFLNIFNDDCHIVLLTDDFIARELRWSTIASVIKEVRRIRKNLKVVIVGEMIEVDVDDAYMLRTSWGSPTRIVGEVEALVVKPIPLRKFEENKIIQKLRYNLSTPDFLVDYVLCNPEIVLPEIRRLVESAYRDIDETNMLRSELDTLVLENAQLKSTIEAKGQEQERLMRHSAAIASKYAALVSKINKQYNKEYYDNYVEGFDVEYNKYDKILVVKEFTRVHFVDSLLYYVQRILSAVNELPTRYCVIEREYSYSSARMYPNHISHDRLTFNQLNTSDICIIGYQQDIVNSVLQNPSGSKYLIVLDRSGHDFVPIRGDRVRILYTMSDLSDNKYFGAPADLIISYNTDNFVIPVIEGFDKMSDPERVAAYSSLEITKSIINAIESRE